jgi:hypothetical protein
MLSGALDQQGVLFNKLQNNISRGISNRTGHQAVRLPLTKGKEGFTDKLLNKKYTDVTADYTHLQTELQDNNLDILKRLDPKTNATLGKNIALNDSSSTFGYVTDQGIFKAYNPSTSADAEPGLFGCPSSKKVMKVDVNESDQLNYSTPGYTFTTENFPKLLVGQPMQSGAACGGAGKNVYVDRLVDKPAASYVGCYSNKDDFKSMGPMDYSSCMSSAMSTGNAYFGLTTDANNQTNCMVSNAFNTNGQEQLSAFSPVLVWESATKNEGNSSAKAVNCCTVTTEGMLVVSDASDATKVLFQSNDAVASCLNGGKINNLVATFGGNCADKYNVATGNATNAVMSAFNNNSNFSFLVNDKNINLTSNDCENKAWDASYQCGNVSKISHMDAANGKNATFDCDTEVATCTFAFTLKNNGNACLFQTKNGEHQAHIWCMAKNGKTAANAEFAATKGKTGTNSLNNGQTLFAGEWIGSNNGALRLVMQADGNLCLYSYAAVETCAKNNGSDYMTGLLNVNAVYKIDNMGNQSVLGKMGYIDQDDVLHDYAASALTYSDTYTLLPNTTISGNNLGDPVSNSTVDACKTACSANAACGGYAFESGANVCYLKNGASEGHVTKQGTASGIRLPQVLQKKSCATDTVNISSEKYDRYVKGDELIKGSICNPFSSNPVSETTKVQYAQVNEDLAALGSSIMGGINRFSENIGKSQRKFAKTGKKMMKSVQSYKDVYKKTHDQNQMIKEGMLNMQDLSRMKSDSELLVTHQNMRYIYWMLAALGLITVCMAVANKKR